MCMETDTWGQTYLGLDLPVMQDQDAHMLCGWVLHLLQTYSHYNKGRVSVQTAASLRQEATSESYRSAPAHLAAALCKCQSCARQCHSRHNLLSLSNAQPKDQVWTRMLLQQLDCCLLDWV